MKTSYNNRKDDYKRCRKKLDNILQELKEYKKPKSRWFRLKQLIKGV